MATRKKSPSKKASTKKKKSSNGLTAAPSTSLTATNVHAIGASVELSDDDRAALSAAHNAVTSAHEDLGTATESYERRKLQLVKQAGESRKLYHELVYAIAAKYDIDLGPESKQSWKYEPQTNVYERTA